MSFNKSNELFLLAPERQSTVDIVHVYVIDDCESQIKILIKTLNI